MILLSPKFERPVLSVLPSYSRYVDELDAVISSSGVYLFAVAAGVVVDVCVAALETVIPGVLGDTLDIRRTHL